MRFSETGKSFQTPYVNSFTNSFDNSQKISFSFKNPTSTNHKFQ